MKKLFLLLCAACTMAACNDKDDNSVVYLSDNTSIENGSLTGHNMHFYGQSTVTDPQNNVFVDKKAYFEIAGGSEQLTLYMHATRFAAQMPAVEMRISMLPYTGSGKSISFDSASPIIPEALIAAAGSYQPMPRYTITNFDGTIDNTDCDVTFTCMGLNVVFAGKLVKK